MRIKKYLGILGLAIAAVFFLAACGQKNDKNTLTVGVMTMTSSDKARWDKISELLKKENIKLKFKEFTDYSQPNKALKNGEVDVNAFQHRNFLNDWNKKNHGNLVTAAETYISPVNLFPGTENGKAKYTNVKEIPDGAQIAIPNDPTNESRALFLLQAAGLIKLKSSADTLATKKDIKSNPKDLDIKEVDASQTARNLSSVDGAVVNNSYAVPAKLDFKTSLYKEKVTADSKQWVNIIAAQKNWKKSKKAATIKKLIKAYHTDAVKKVIEKTAKGVDEPVW
ncbi:MetQ/NlpA family ABC transporter substrate-binding protein [Streptococcus macacae]|uniref:Lipoprotein n=1 Tax=Streptococcus macacae NCTC 11558 TaxID=764298 RepID=G5JV00_9STRE|nr:MetQ/NlpA family ABC transporter substrate-binding protein [Streptococcus macacae]EHJ52457.1 NLPA lipoprotein [Streptococcus macacae NCTC 11558]SUN79297.1 membrane lipoprotein [Streptococcus macacae NCTC 11558]